MVKRYARVYGGMVCDVTDDPFKKFHPVVAAEFVLLPDGVEQGWLQGESGDFYPPPEEQEPPLNNE